MQKKIRCSHYSLTSDHRCINFKINLDSIPPILFRNPASTNWPYFTKIISDTLNTDTHSSQNLSEYDLENDVLYLQLILLDAYELACPIHRHKAGNSVPYYTTEDKNQRQKSKTKGQFNKSKLTKNWTITTKN